MNKKYSYLAVFYPDEVVEHAINIEFPDLPGCVSCAYNRLQAKKYAKKALLLYLDGFYVNAIPKPHMHIEKNTYDMYEKHIITVRMKITNGRLKGRGIKTEKRNQ